MGKASNGLGKFSGKVGGVVFAISNGEQIVKAYQPVVSNPKSSLQLVQRAKGNLTGRISSFVPRTAIAGLGNNNRTRRGEFLRNILKGAIVTQSGGNYNAKIADENVLFSKGYTQLSVTLASVTAAAGQVSVSLIGDSESLIPAEEYAARQTRLVCMIYDNVTQELVEVATKIATKPTQGNSQSTALPISRQGGYIAVVYAIPMSTSDGSAITISTDMAGKSDADIAAMLSANKNAVIFNYGNSVVLGQGTYTPSAKENEHLNRKAK